MVTDALLDYWASFMSAEGLGERTIRERLALFRTIETEIGKPLLEVNRQDLITYLGSPVVRERWSAGTRRHYRSSIHTFFTWAQDEGLRVDNPAARLPRISVKPHDPNPVAVDDIQLMVTTGAYRNTRMMIALHYYAGLRVHEIAKIHGRDIDWRHRILAVFGKGAVTRRIGLGDALWDLAQDYPRDEFWFPNKKPNRLYSTVGEGHVLSNSVSDAIRDAFRRSGIDNHRPHDLRASTATEQHLAGVPLFKTQKAMRHSSSATTEFYTRIDIEGTREAFNAQPTIDFPARSGRKRAA